MGHDLAFGTRLERRDGNQPSRRSAPLGGARAAPFNESMPTQNPLESRDNNYGTLTSPTPNKEKVMAQRFASYIGRVGRNPNFRKGVAAVSAGTLIAAIIEAAWPTA